MISKNLYVAYSGGVDSHVLLHLVANSFDNVSAIHINHALSSEDDCMQQHCERVCAALNISLQCITVDAKPKGTQSPEDAARQARRSAWLATLSKNDILLLAHHAQDQAETILYRLFRGAGPKGLGGMSQSSLLGAVQILRPLLEVSKQKILAYAQQHNLNYIEDSTNANLNFDRNFIRQQVLPLIEQRWPQACNNINRAGLLLKQQLQCLEPQLQVYLQQCSAQADQLSILKLQAIPNQWQNQVLRTWLQQHGTTPSCRQLQQIQQEVMAAREDANPIFAFKNFKVRRSNDILFIVFDTAESTENFSCQWDLLQQPELQLPTGAVLKASDMQFATTKLEVRLGQHGVKAKKIFQAYAIPPWERAKYPLLVLDGRLIAIVGLWVNPRVLTTSC